MPVRQDRAHIARRTIAKVLEKRLRPRASS